MVSKYLWLWKLVFIIGHRFTYFHLECCSIRSNRKPEIKSSKQTFLLILGADFLYEFSIPDKTITTQLKPSSLRLTNWCHFNSFNLTFLLLTPRGQNCIQCCIPKILLFSTKKFMAAKSHLHCIWGSKLKLGKSAPMFRLRHLNWGLRDQMTKKK